MSQISIIVHFEILIFTRRKLDENRNLDCIILEKENTLHYKQKPILHATHEFIS